MQHISNLCLLCFTCVIVQVLILDTHPHFKSNVAYEVQVLWHFQELPEMLFRRDKTYKHKLQAKQDQRSGKDQQKKATVLKT